MILDIMMPKMDGLEVLQRVKETHPDIDVIMVTGLSQIETAVQAMKLGAFDYLPKPFDPDELKLVVERALERRRLLQENLNLKSEVSSKYRFENIIGASPRDAERLPPDRQVRPDQQHRPAHRRERHRQGTGRARHPLQQPAQGQARSSPVDCTALSENLLESELFGHVKGSFTGAVANKRGMFEVADGGTLFLDEIGNISLSTQAKLLRVIQEREFRAVGDTRTPGRRRPAHRRHQQGPRGDGRRRRRSARTSTTASTSSRSTCRRCASAARTFPRSPTISSRSSARNWASKVAEIFGGRDERAGEPRLAGQRARAGERHAARA